MCDEAEVMNADFAASVLMWVIFVGENVLQMKPSPEDLDVILSATRLPRFFRRFLAEFMRKRANEEARVAATEGLPEIEAVSTETDALVKGNRANPCFLFRLPLAVRARIWEMLFWPSDDRWVVAPRITVPGVAILQASKQINFETSIAFAQALVSCPMMVMYYPDHCFLRQPFPLLKNLGDRIFRSLTLPLGDRQDPLKAMKRSLDFIQFLTVLRDQHPIMVYEVSIFIQKDWKVPQVRFDEDGLAKLLVSGPFAFLNKITVSGVLGAADYPGLQRCLRIHINEK